jgi:hypothetical protein
MPSLSATIRKGAVEVIENKEATVRDRLKACSILLRLKALTTKGKPRGRGFPRKIGEPLTSLDRILDRVQ